MHSENLLMALRELVRAEIAAELDRRATGTGPAGSQQEKPEKLEKAVSAREDGKAELAEESKAEQARDPIVPLEGRGPAPTDKDRSALTAALKALIVEQNDAAQEFRQLVRDGKQCACSACREWGEFEAVVDFINYRRGLKNGRA